jgi:PAS domain S-box-containing protein
MPFAGARSKAAIIWFFRKYLPKEYVMRILIAEDDLSSRLALVGILKKSGHEVIETKDGVEAWTVLQQNNAPQLVILDWMMPRLSGLEVLQRLRAQTPPPLCYVLLLTAKTEKNDIIQGLDAGADDYLAKPFDAGELLARINVGKRVLDIQDRLAKKIGELRKSEEKHRLLLEKTSDLICSCSLTGLFEYVNTSFSQEMGLQEVDIIGKSVHEIFPPDTVEKFTVSQERAQRTGQEQRIELLLSPSDPEKCYLTSITPVTDDQGMVLSTLCSSKEITERKRLETYREMGRDILQLLNEPLPLQDSLARIIDLLKRGTGFDAIGIRLQEGENFPYMAQQGFSPAFFRQENSLIGRMHNGAICRDEQGRALLECTCGLVISGCLPPASPLFSPGGSFWTNNSIPLQDLPATEDPRFRPRNLCMRYQYASMALIPIRNKGTIIGLLHCNDRRKDRFTANTIETLEGIASHIGAALMRKQAEEALQSKRKRLKDIIDFLPDATMAIDRAGQVIIWNKAMEQMTGISAQEMIGRGDYAYSVPFYGTPRPQLIDLISATDEEINARYRHVFRQGDTLTTEVMCQSLFGNVGAWVFAKASPLRDQNGEIVGAIETIRDITYKKQMEDKLKHNISWFQALFNATSDSVMLVKPDGQILDLNNNAALRRNLSKEAMRGKSIFDFLPQESSNSRCLAINQILQQQSLIEYDETRQDKHYHIRLYPIMDEQGQVIQVASFSRDITQTKIAEEEKKRLQSQLIQAQKMEALGTLAGGIAHDFNNILGGILGYSSMARESCPNESTLARYLDRVIEAGERAANLVRQILTYNRKNPSERVLLQPATMVKEALRLLRPSLPSTITIVKDIPASTKNIFADPTQVQQILMNLCVNAFHAMEENGGRLVIALHECTLSPRDLAHHPDIRPGSFICLSVQDNGVGIQPELRDKIFDPYFTTKGIGKGSGMGLSIVLGLVASYGGLVTCESEWGKGSTFRVYFPAHAETPAQQEVKDVLLPRGKERILFVDDEAVIAEMGRTMLESLGYQVQAVTCSMEALALFQSNPFAFDAVITDLTMPRMTGTLLAEQMLHIRPDIRILLCTGYSSTISEEKAKSMGIQAFATKPLIMKDLAVLLREVLDGEQRDGPETMITKYSVNMVA